MMYIPNDDTQYYPSCRLQSDVETFGHSNKWTNQSNSMNGGYAKNKVNVILIL